MALSFTSNKKATNVISDASGYKGPLDYFLNADIANDVYLIQDNGNKTYGNMEEIFQVARSSSRGHVLDENLNISEVNANFPRRSYLPAYDSFGILIEEARYNFFDQATLATKKTTTLPSTTNTFACYALGGSAKASASEVDIIGGTGTYNDPQFFTLKSGGTLTPTITVSGSPKAIQVEQLVAKPSASAVPSVSAATKAAESMSIPATGIFTSTQGCIILNILENKPNIDNGKSGYIPYVQIGFDENNYLAMNRRVERNILTLRLFREGSEVLASQVALSTLNNKVALSWNNGVISYAVNGVAYEISTQMNLNFKANLVRLLSAVSGWVTADGNAALSNMIIYNRALSLTELEKATASW
ncbi:hypothetical protein OW684_01880 [Acinetobacter baumannii]|uniref:hypothetical protein n=1 Tax=Acinetobacter baumannii TaxID=470 RepID=UPI002340FCAB|nr:hypothetical protein [Acinetobacter baumannii]MDC4953563.1 hypothetical protein [Acinetobacter baumannii]MDK2105162.1 hypothetical protein [Acinetobacter baumannii]MDK2110498.1 hypothetical protein [Acinetobacter baumannii]MDK2140008.1 hypothetical protein [Acinetobacter baumannii]MDK2150878.1 hypothetical protein [Acinetobacter baumannii]